MNDKELTHDDFLQRLDIRDVLLDAGYRQNRRFGLRLSSFIRTDSEGKRIRGDKFVITQHGKCCCQPPRQKEYNVVSFIKEHPHLFAEYHEGINPDRLVELVCYRLLHYPIPEQETRTGQPQRDTRPFDIADYNIQKFDPQDRGTQEKFAPYFEKRGIDLCTQQTFHRDFCLATRHSEDGQRRTCLAFPMTLPEDADKIVGFEKRGHAYTDGNSSYDDMTEGNHSGEGVWIASPARTALSEAKHIYWFESASEAMAYYSFIRRKTKSYERRSSSQRAANLPRNRCEACLSLRSRPGSISVSTPVGRGGSLPKPCKRKSAARYAPPSRRHRSGNHISIPYRTAMIWTKENFICCPKAACKRAAYDSMPNGKKPYQ